LRGLYTIFKKELVWNIEKASEQEFSMVMKEGNMIVIMPLRNLHVNDCEQITS
jgi:hypothetical protein